MLSTPRYHTSSYSAAAMPTLPTPASQSITVTFGKRLRTLRTEHGYTQTQLADYLGIDRSFISDVERGKKNMSLTYLETVAQGFKLTLSELTRDL